MPRLGLRFRSAASLGCVCLAMIACSDTARLLTVDEHGMPVAALQQSSGHTLVVDLQRMRSGDSIVMKPPEGGSSWPRVLVLRVNPASVGSLDIQARFRMLIPVKGVPGRPADLTVLREVYSDPTPQITVRFR